MPNPEERARKLERTAARLMERALKMEQEDDGADVAEINALMDDALVLRTQAADFRKQEGLPPRNPIEEYHELLKAYGAPSSDEPQEPRSPYGFWSTRHGGV